MTKFPLLFSFLLLAATVAESQVIVMDPAPRRAPLRQRMRTARAPFRPALSLSIGYGYPNLDRNYLPDYYGYSMGSISQTGVITGSVDYRLSRRMSLGVLVTHGTVSAPYYNFYTTSTLPDLTGKLDNWSVMLRWVRYFPVSLRFTPYLATSLGVNIWKQDFVDPYGNKVAVSAADVPDLAYQGAIGARFSLIRHVALFTEVGFRKYIVRGGLSVTL